MSVEVTIVCDDCGRVITAALTAYKARGELREQGGRTLKGGEDLCPGCAERRHGRRVALRRRGR